VPYGPRPKEEIQKFLGKTKLMKLFYFMDFMHVKKYGCPVTYDQYVNLTHGPIPSTILNLVDEAVEDIDHSSLADTITIEKTENGMCRIKTVNPFTAKDEDYFKPSELEILKSVCQRFGEANTKTIEDASHEEAPWKNTTLLDRIAYSMATLDADCLVSKEEIELLQQL
jgi:uncharacterized phage-associated protein